MNEKTKNGRIASFDWLRMILAFFVIVLHFNNSNGGSGAHLYCRKSVWS